MRQEILLKEKTGKLFMRFSFASVLGMIGISIYVLADTFFVANGIGQDALAGLNIALPMYSLLVATGLFVGIGCCSSYSIQKGMGQEKKANAFFTLAVVLGLVFGAVCSVIGLAFSENIAGALGADSATLEYCATYIKTIMSFAPAFIMNQILLAFLRNVDRPNLAMVSMLAGSVFNIVMDYVTVYLWGWGMFGAAIATAFSPVVGILVMLPGLLSKKSGLKLKKEKITSRMIKSMASGGTSSFVVEMSVGLVILVFNMIMLNLAGNTGVAAYGIVSNVSIVATSIFTGLGQALQPIASTNYGAGKTARIRSTLLLACLIALAAGTAIYIIGATFADGITSLFNSENNAELAKITTEGIRIYFIAFIPMSINFVLSYFFQSVLCVKQSVIISLMRGFVLVSLFAVLLSNILGVTGVWLAALGAEAITIVFALISTAKWFRVPGEKKLEQAGQVR